MVCRQVRYDARIGRRTLGDNEHIPTLESLKKFIPADKLWPINDTWYLHAGAIPDAERAARQQALDELKQLERQGIVLSRTNTGNFYLLASGFLPAYPVRLFIDGKLIARLTANTLGDVTYMIDPALLHLARGRHAATLGSMLIPEAAGFTVS